jgi:hypothetical protein
VLLLWSACTEFLNKEPVDMLTENLIYSDKAAYKANIAYLYTQIPFDFVKYEFNLGFLSYYTGEMVERQGGATTNMNYGFNSWSKSYKLIRALNLMIEKTPSATVFVTDKEKTVALGELRFMRAYIYFSLVQRYGGVPLVLKASGLPESGDVSELYLPRNKAADIYTFIETEMTETIGMMSVTADKYRFNKWSGLALKTQAMLHAAAIATYDAIQLNGLIGIPNSEAKHYWESARDAAKLLIDTGPYVLYDVDANKITNYHNLFFDETAANKERIFDVGYIYPLNGHTFDQYMAPFSLRASTGNCGHFCPTYEMAESYEYTNNSNGTLKINNPDGTPIEYTDPADLFKNKDPRFFATILFPGAYFRGKTLEIYGSMIKNGVEVAGSGVDGLTSTESSSTAFYLSKWADPNPPRPVATGSSDVDRQIIRYAEVILNYAEAQLELGNEPEARKYINMIRVRAGLQPLIGPVTMNDYKHERKIELAFENHLYWDYKRWRIFTTVMNNTDTYGLWPVYNVDKKVYIFRKTKLTSTKYTRTFSAYLYYSKLDAGLIASNPLLVENPGW